VTTNPDRTPRHARPRTILAVDDSRTNLGVLGQRLGQAGYLVVVSDNGREALDLITGRGFDLVLLDLGHPGVTGMQMINEIRSSPDTADLPVIMITERSEPAAAVEALAAGADDWIAKPFAFEVLIARIERMLARSTRLHELKRANVALDARIAARAIELGEARADLATTRADRVRLISSIQALHDEVERLSLPDRPTWSSASR
jgi:DNA-binding response OmpR family regulator